MKKLILYFFLFIYMSCFNATAQITLDEDDLKDLTNQEFIGYLDDILKYFTWMEHVMLLGNDDNKDISKERTQPAYQTDTIEKVQTFQNFLNANFSFEQSMDNNGSNFKTSNENYFSINHNKNLLDINIDTLFFCDGTTENSEEELDLTFNNKIDIRKEIDSISLNVSVNYITDFETIELNKAKKTATYNGKSIKIENLDGNYLVVSYDSELHPFLIEGLNAKKEVLDDYQSMTSDQHPNEARKMYEQVKSDMKKIEEQATADSTLTQEAFRAKYLPKMNKFIEQYFAESDVKFKEFHYYGNVDGARLYFAKNRNKLEGKKIIKNKDKKTFYIDYENDGTLLYDKLGNVVFQDAKEYEQLNSYFYEDDKHFYWLNLAEKRMKPVLCYDLKALDNNYVMVQHDENEPYFIVNKENQLEVPNRFRKINYKGNILYAINADNDSILFIPESGEKKWMKNITHISDFENGYAVIRSNEKYGFIDNQANIIIPIIYNNAEKFDRFDFYTPEDMLFIVKKGDSWGAVNRKNEIAIPFIYNELKPFSYGITHAENKDGKWGLINTKNKAVVPFTANGYSLSTNFGRRQYYMNGENYDYLGRLEGNYEYQDIEEYPIPVEKESIRAY